MSRNPPHLIAAIGRMPSDAFNRSPPHECGCWDGRGPHGVGSIRTSHQEVSNREKERTMTFRNPFLLVSAATMLALALWPAFQATTAQEGAPSALTGQVRSAREARMEGVLVTAKRAGSNVATTVVSGADGSYSFPKGR